MGCHRLNDRLAFTDVADGLVKLEIEMAFLGAAFSDNRVFTNQPDLKPDAFADAVGDGLSGDAEDGGDFGVGLVV